MGALKVLWFGDIGRPTSFSRISDSVLPHLISLGVLCYILAPPRALINKTPPNVTTIYHVGDSIPSIGMTWETFKGSQEDSLSLNMKYALLQAIQYSRDENMDYIIFVIGIYEADWFMNLFNNARLSMPVKAKVVVWTPLDYKPSLNVIENICKADMLFTMTESSRQSIINVLPQQNIKINVVPHAVSSCFYKVSRKNAYRFLKPFVKTLNKDDIVILNANNYVERKQIHLTIEAFAAVRTKNVKLWLHTNAKSPDFLKMLDYYRKKFHFSENDIIVTMNNVPEETLNYIYNFCQIGLQTSWGEGWSLTNCEHAMTGAIQVVPDFLATGEHFRNTKYIYPANEKDYVNEAGHSIKIADIQLENIIPALQSAIESQKQYNQDRCGASNDTYQNIISYLRGFTWEAIANQIKDLMIEHINM